MLGVTLSGPIFDGRHEGMGVQMVQAVRKTLAFASMEGWQEGLSHTLRHPTGAYQSRLNIEKRGDALVLNDLRSVYGPWLEGTGSRNSPVTRFPRLPQRPPGDRADQRAGRGAGGARRARLRGEAQP